MPRRGARGFTLLEVLMSCLLLSIGLFAVISLYPQAILGLHKARQMNVAGDLAQRALDEATSLPFDEVRDASTSQVVDQTTYTTNLSVVLLDTGLKKVCVEVVWWFPREEVPTTHRRRLSVAHETRVLDLPDL